MCKDNENALGQVTDRHLNSTAGVICQKYSYTQAENFRLTALQSGVSPNYNTLQNVTYSYDDQGNVLTVVDAAAYGGSQTQTFSYDALNRLLSAQAAGGSYGTYSQRSYVYTSAGSITTFEGAALGYNDAGHKHAVTHVAGVQRYWYDQNGNATRRVNGSQDVTLAYGAENHVTSITGSGINASYVYDGDGQRVKATVGGVTTVYIGNYYERDNGTTVRKYYYAGAVRVALRTGGNTFYLLNDHLTSTAITTNSSGVRQTELRYYAYGGTRYDAGSQLTLYRYTGQRVETGTGLYDYGARWFDPLIGRFLAADSIVPNPGDSQALNRYMYVLGNPLKYSDPSGHAACAADDRGCWENEWIWKDRWYRSHGYQFYQGNYRYTGNYVFANTDAARELIRDVASGNHHIGQGASFTFDLGRITIGLEQRGSDTLLTEVLGVIGLTADIVDFGLTSGFAAAYTLEQGLTAATGPGAAAGFAAGQAAYTMIQPVLLGVDVIGLAAVFGADFGSGRTSLSLTRHELTVGLDTIVSATSLGISSMPIVVPGVYLGLTGDAVQISYITSGSAGLSPPIVS
jgi:RHS repeat-associated protein